MIDDDKKSDILWVQESGTGLYLMFIDYRPDDPNSAAGHIHWIPDSDDEEPAQILATNDPLTTLWASPSGSVWAASAHGNVYTTAKVTWPAPRVKGLDFDSLDPDVPFQVTTLPATRGTRRPPNVTALWGTSDRDVFAGTYGGTIYHWDGRKWTEADLGAKRAINAIHGPAGNVFAVGYDDVIAHFDGTEWRRLRDPDGGAEVLTGVCWTGKQAVICSGSGRLLAATPAQVTTLASSNLPLQCVATLGPRILLGAGPKGVAELRNGVVKVIKDDVLAVNAMTGRDRVYFVEAAQEVSAFVIYDPEDEDEGPWIVMSF
ncbi:MAG TPA: hypothetical protein VH165_32755 [Kofleriaceae bacterium]|jgi:hypothetical protein|nr:hypothetical protein [Kofleriaceae bacterium]